MRILVLAPLLAACAAEPPPSPRKPDPFEDYKNTPPYSSASAAPYRAQVAPATTAEKRPGAAADPSPRCLAYQTEIAEYKERIAHEKEKEAAWRKDHCKPVLHRETAIDPVTGARASSAYDAGYMECDGKIVNIDGAESDAHIDLRNQMGAVSSKWFAECQQN